MMIGYVTVGTNDLERAIAFYDALLGELGIERMWANERGAAWGNPQVQALLVTKPFDGAAVFCMVAIPAQCVGVGNSRTVLRGQARSREFQS